ncbi:MAG: DUF3237 domain-containing protein [Halioglobus sp.]|nr:DUF3237 domain-containing protein [Halioglobus sp.]
MEQADYEQLLLRGEWLCDVELAVADDAPGTIESPWGATNIAYIGGGEFAGPRLGGRVLPGGGDWPALSVDGKNSYRLDVRAVWETHDGARLFVQYYGFIAIAPELLGTREQLAALDPSQYYFRAAPTFRTGDARYQWLNTTLCVGVGRFTREGLGYRVFALD